MCNAIANVFTTFIENSKDQRKINAQVAVLKAYERLRPHGVQGWLFTSSDEWARRAEEHHVLVVRTFSTNRRGTPLLGGMYKHVANATESKCGAHSKDVTFDSYANGDIVFTMSLVDTLQQVRRGWGRELAAGARKGILIVGKRTNVDFHSQPLESDGDVNALAKTGKLFQNDAQDFFFYTRAARDWDMMPGDS